MIIKFTKADDKNKLDKKLFYHRYNSYTKFIHDAINGERNPKYYKKEGYKNYHSDLSSERWRGGTNEEAESLALNGWDTGIKSLAPEYTAYRNFGNTPRPSFAGSKINISAIIGNDPRVYYKLKNKVSSMERLVVWIPLGFSGGNSSDEVLAYGKTALEYVAELNKTFDVSVNAYYFVKVSSEDTYYNYSCKLKEFGQNMVINNFAYALHPSFTRVMGFRMQEQAVYNSGMGTCQFDKAKNKSLINMIKQESCRHVMLPILDRYSDSKTMAEQITEVSK